jgi:hypothetical protein
VAELLVKEQHVYHCEHIHSHRPDPKIYLVGDIVFACQAVRSDATRGQLDKLTYPFTRLWRVIAKLHNTLYKLKHCLTKSKEKKHTSDLSPYPVELIPFQPLDGADNQYGQLYQKFKGHPYGEVGIKWFMPPTPFAIPIQFLQTNADLSFQWPTLAKLNDELHPDGPPPPTPTCLIPSTPLANTLAQRIINSTNRLFFISRKIDGSVDNIRKWRLIGIALAPTMAYYPLCLDDGCYAVDFYIFHPADFWCNAINRRFWIQYHNGDDLSGPCSSLDKHLIHPSDTSTAYAKRNKLLPVRRFLNLTHPDTYIHGPFNIATINGRKSCD